MFATTLLGYTFNVIWSLFVLVIWISIAFWPARVASRKGHSFFVYFLISLFFFPLALILAYMATDRSLPPTVPPAPTA